MPFVERPYTPAQLLRECSLSPHDVTLRRERVFAGMRTDLQGYAVPLRGPWSFTEADFARLVALYNDHFFDGHLAHALWGLRLVLRVVWLPQARCYGQCEMQLAGGRSLTIDINLHTVLQAAASAAASAPAHQSRQFASGVYRADELPLRLIAEVFEHEVCHAIVFAAGCSRKSNQRHGSTFVAVFNALFKPHRSRSRQLDDCAVFDARGAKTAPCAFGSADQYSKPGR